jgi:hypothetical protein
LYFHKGSGTASVVAAEKDHEVTSRSFDEVTSSNLKKLVWVS